MSIAVLILLYVVLVVELPAMAAATGLPGLAVPLAFLLYALGLGAWVLRAPEPCTARRVLGLIGDLGALSYILVITGPIGAPWYPIYLWVILGNAIRYGLRYLYAGMALGVIGFSSVIVLTEYWHSNLALGLGLLAGLCVLPLYAARLLQSLNSALDRSEEASKAKTRFLANMSHELRTPLNGVIAVSDLLGETKLSGEQRDMVQTVQASARTLLELINQVLDISRIETGKVAIERSPFDLYRLIQETAAIVRPQALGKGLTFNVFIDSGLDYRMRGDGFHLRQVLLNLLGNAVKFTERGHVSLRVFARGKESERLRLRFEVEDTGIGIPEAARSRVFEPFGQADESVTRRYGGTGLGTTIAKQLVELLGGHIAFESTLGHGTTFWFELALEREDECGRRVEARELPSRFEVLTVGCDEAMRAWVERSVVHAGLSPTHHERIEGAIVAVRAITARNGEQAVLLVDARSIGLPLEVSRSLERERLRARVSLVALDVPGSELEVLIGVGYLSAVATRDDEQLDRALHAVALERGAEPAVLEPEPGRAAPCHILLAEDNLTNQKVTRMILERAGHRVEAVANGRAALERLKGDSFDLAILDMHMPEMDGIEVVRLYRFVHPGRSLPFLLLTADATRAALAESEAAGLEGYLTKPVRAQVLRAKVEELAGRAQVKPVRCAEEKPVGAVLAELDALECEAPGFLLDVAAAFVADTAQRVEGMQASIVGSQWGRFVDDAHKLRGAAATIGASALAARCEALERTRPDELERDAPRLLVELRAECERAREALEAHLGQTILSCGQDDPSRPTLIEKRRSQ